MIFETFNDFKSKLHVDYEKDGYSVVESSNIDGLVAIKKLVEASVANSAKIKVVELSNIHHDINPSQINQIRTTVFEEINNYEWVRPTLYSSFKASLDEIVGNEIVAQNRLNLGIMMPEDSSSNISLHADTDSGESPFQAVVWTPLTKVGKGNGVFLLPEKNRFAEKVFWSKFETEGLNAATESIKDYLIEPQLEFGQALIFDSSLLHGSFPNPSETTRVSLNIRFKGLLTPDGSGEKGLGSFFRPVVVKPATRRGIVTI